MAAYKKVPLPLGHKPKGQQRQRGAVGVPRREVPVPLSAFSGFRGRRAFLEGITSRQVQIQPTSASHGTFNTQGRKSFP